jgi:hypothetical protein
MSIERLGLRYAHHARRRMAERRISEAEVEEAWTTRHVTVLERAGARRSSDVLVIRSALRSGRRLKLVVRADDQRFVITVAAQEGDR